MLWANCGGTDYEVRVRNGTVRISSQGVLILATDWRGFALQTNTRDEGKEADVRDACHAIANGFVELEHAIDAIRMEGL